MFFTKNMYVCERFKGNELYVIFWNIWNQFLISVIRSGVHRGISIGEAIATPPPPTPPCSPNNFSDFCFAKYNKTCSAIHLCCHLYLPREQNMVNL